MTAQGSPDPASAAAPPSRRSALLRTGFILAVLFVVFAVIIPRYVDYEEVLEAFQELSLAQFALISVLGLVAWFVAGQLFTALVAGLSMVRGMTAFVILSGIGASVPFGPWNMGVVWVVIRGWGIASQPATAGVALYGVMNQLGRLAMPLVGLLVLIATGELARDTSGTALFLAVLSTVIFVIASLVIVAIVRSDRLADSLGRAGGRTMNWTLTRFGRHERPDVSAAIHRFRDQFGEVIHRRGLVSLGVAIGSQVIWSFILVVALRLCGVPETALPPADVIAVFALVTAITIIPLSPGGAGVPELLYIAGLTTIAGAHWESAITAGVFLFRLYQWFLPIPIAWILLKLVRRGRPMLPTTVELRSMADGSPVPEG